MSANDTPHDLSRRHLLAAASGLAAAHAAVRLLREEGLPLVGRGGASFRF